VQLRLECRLPAWNLNLFNGFWFLTLDFVPDQSTFWKHAGNILVLCEAHGYVFNLYFRLFFEEEVFGV